MAWISFGALLAGGKNFDDSSVSMLLNSRASLICFRACFLPCRDKDFSAPRYYGAVYSYCYLIISENEVVRHFCRISRVRYDGNLESTLTTRCDATRAETWFRLSAKRTSAYKSAAGRQFSRLLAAEVCASAVVMLDTPCSEVVWRVLATHCIRQFSLHLPSRASPCAITFQLDSNCMCLLLCCTQPVCSVHCSQEYDVINWPVCTSLTVSSVR